MTKSRFELCKEKISSIANSRPAGWATSASFGAGVASAVMYVKDALSCCLPTACGAAPLGWFCFGATCLTASCLHSQRTAATDREVAALKTKLQAQKRHEKKQDEKIASLEAQVSRCQFKLDQENEAIERIAKILAPEGTDSEKKVAEIMPPVDQEFQVRIFPKAKGRQPGSPIARSGIFKPKIPAPRVQSLQTIVEEDESMIKMYAEEYEARKGGVDKVDLRTPLLKR